MVKHIVVWKLKNMEDSEMLKKAIESLYGKIPGLISIEAGIDFNRSNASGDIVLISVHKDKASLDLYQTHPEHVIVKDLIVPRVLSRTVVDFEV